MKCERCGNPRFKKVSNEDLGFIGKVFTGTCSKCGKIMYTPPEIDNIKVETI
jgi:uncharacterized OB-fold protein